MGEARGTQRREDAAGFSERPRENTPVLQGALSPGVLSGPPLPRHKHFPPRLASSSRSLPQGLPLGSPLPIPSWPPRNRLPLVQQTCCHVLPPSMSRWVGKSAPEALAGPAVLEVCWSIPQHHVGPGRAGTKPTPSDPTHRTAVPKRPNYPGPSQEFWRA